MPKIYVTASTGNPLRSTLMQAAGKERPMDAGSIQSAIASRLPQRARWHIGDTTPRFLPLQRATRFDCRDRARPLLGASSARPTLQAQAVPLEPIHASAAPLRAALSMTE